MIYILLSNSKTGMVLARDVVNELSLIPLFSAGDVLNELSIKKLSKLDVSGIFIESKLSENSEERELIKPTYNEKTLTAIKHVFDEYSSNHAVSEGMISQISKTAEGMVLNALTNDECLLQVMKIKTHDSYTYTHSMCVAILSSMIGIQLGFNKNQLNDLTLCGLLHDIGKVEVPAEIINRPGPLTEKEYELVKRHSNIGMNRLRYCKTVSDSVLAGIVSHHEKWDGSGYPNGLKGKEIPLFGRILALADVYDALTSDRSYRKALSPSDAIEFMISRADKCFDHELLEIFLKIV